MSKVVEVGLDIQAEEFVKIFDALTKATTVVANALDSMLSPPQSRDPATP